MKSDITKFVGCDLGDENSHLCWLGAAGAVEKREKLKTSLQGFTDVFSKQERALVVIEAGSHSPWVSRLLTKLGHKVLVANPRQVRLISQSKNKNDRVDAERLARLGRVDVQLLSPIEHRSEKAQHDLIAIKMRRQLVETRTAMINFVRGIAKSFGYKLKKCDTACFAERARQQLPKALVSEVVAALQSVEQLSTKIDKLDAQIEKKASKSTAVSAITQITGVGILTAQTFVCTLEDAHRFKRSRTVGAYLGLTPRRSQSGEDDPQLRITKHGDVYLRSLLINCAHYILGPFGPDSDLRRHGERIAKDSGKNAKKRAVVAVARKLSVLMHRLWLTGEEYQALGYPSLQATAQAA